MKIYINNRACESCNFFVKDSFDELRIIPKKVELGKTGIKEGISDIDKNILKIQFKKGLELLERKESLLLERIRQVIINYVYNSDDRPNLKFSVMLSQQLNYSYAYLSNFFSEFGASTIEQYIIALKIKRIKELIILDEYTFSEIAYKLNYSSAAHLSTQFKKVTGLTPSDFKVLRSKRNTHSNFLKTYYPTLQENRADSNI